MGKKSGLTLKSNVMNDWLSSIKNRKNLLSKSSKKRKTPHIRISNKSPIQISRNSSSNKNNKTPVRIRRGDSSTFRSEQNSSNKKSSRRSKRKVNRMRSSMPNFYQTFSSNSSKSNYTSIKSENSQPVKLIFILKII